MDRHVPGAGKAPAPPERSAQTDGLAASKRSAQTDDGPAPPEQSAQTDGLAAPKRSAQTDDGPAPPERSAQTDDGPAAPKRSAQTARRRADLVGTPIFWLTVAVTMCAAVPFAFLPIMRAWLGCAVLLMWSAFFSANALRSRRTHSAISAPVYLLASALLAGNALGLIEVQIWMVWVLGAGIIAANLSERFIGKYF